MKEANEEKLRNALEEYEDLGGFNEDGSIAKFENGVNKVCKLSNL